MQRLNCRPSATGAAIAGTEKDLGLQLPDEYVQFLQITNGFEGTIGKSAYVDFWRVEELVFMNKSYEVQRSAPGLMIFGSDGGGEAFGFDTRSPTRVIVRVPFVVMDWAAASLMGETFSAFLRRLNEI